MITHDETDETHRATCAECRAVWTELEAIAAEARALPTLTPSRDLWQGIEARLGAAGARPIAPRPVRRWFGSPAVRYAAATVLLMAGSAAVTWRIAGERPAAADAAAAPTAGYPADPAVRAALGLGEGGGRTVAYDADFRAMDVEIAAMQRLLEERRASLDSATVRVLEKNLALIDTAIAESRAALAADPASQFLAAQLARSYTTKLTLLRSTATMPVGL